MTDNRKLRVLGIRVLTSEEATLFNEEPNDCAGENTYELSIESDFDEITVRRMVEEVLGGEAHMLSCSIRH